MSDWLDGLARIVSAAYAEAPVWGHRSTEVYDWPRFSPETIGPIPDPEHVERRFYVALGPNRVNLLVNGRQLWLDQMELVTDETGEQRYEVRATTGGRPKSRPLMEHADALGTAWAFHGPAITQQNVADWMGRGLETVGDWFRPGHWLPYKRTGHLPDR